MNLSSFKIRIRVTSVLVIAFALVLIFRLFFVQVVNGDTYADKADRQYVSPSSNIFDRGSIFFSKKDGDLVAAATVASGFKVAINPTKIENPESLYLALNPYLKIDYDTFIYRASKENDIYEEVANRLTKEEITEIENLKLTGVSIYKDSWRFYPGGSLASQTLGFLAYKGDELRGQYGLERYYNDILAKPKDEIYVNFFAEVFSNIEDVISSTGNQGSVVTTIEPNVEHTLESELYQSFEKWKADQAGGIIINPQTGEIYAMVGFPSFDANNFRDVVDLDVYRNPIVENVFEFGSVIKPLVMAGAIDAGVINPDSTYVDQGVVTVDGKQIYNFDKKGRGLVTMQTVLDQSLNTGMVYAESKLGHDKFRNYMKSFGIGERTGIDLPNETYGLIKNLESPRNIEYANAAFGQGIALTPIGAVRAFSALANGGNLISPYLAKQIRYDNGQSKIIENSLPKQSMVSKETAETITRMLVHVFEAYDNGIHKLEHYSVATKTGTAQVAKEGGGGYYENQHMHSFFGYFPAYNPEFLVFLFLQNPKEVKYASQTLIPPFVNITNFLLNYYNVPPDR
ncbi:MAG: penicillin-binding protein 2 [Candidatus Pacebacteria bacterium]|nr:penicillin-binding protein 2 [Candidatus Paceibacterota bacterium]